MTTTTTKNNGLKPSINRPSNLNTPQNSIDINTILSTLNDMIYDKIKIPYTYITHLLSYYITNKQYIQAIEFYNNYHTYSNNPKSQMPDFSVFGHLISAYLKLGHFDSAWGVFQEYNTIVYNNSNNISYTSNTIHTNTTNRTTTSTTGAHPHTNTTSTTTNSNDIAKSSNNIRIKYNKKDICNIYINILNGCCIHNKRIEAILILSLLYPQHVIIKPESLTSGGGGIAARLTLGHNILINGAVEAEKEMEDRLRLGRLLGVKRSLSPMVYEASLNACCNFHMWKEGLAIYDEMTRLGKA